MTTKRENQWLVLFNDGRTPKDHHEFVTIAGSMKEVIEHAETHLCQPGGVFACILADAFNIAQGHLAMYTGWNDDSTGL